MMSDNIKILSADNVGFSYPGYPPVLSGFSASLYSGEVVCVIGASGCGKSTMLNLAGGFLTADSGEISDSRGRVSTPSPSRIMVFQDSGQLFPWLTAAGNVKFPLTVNARRSKEAQAADNLRVEKLLNLVGLSDAASLYPSQLSGGMKQRAVIARALAGSPEILLLDEPFTALDAPTRRGLQDTLLELNAELGVSMIFVTHDIREAVYLADRIMVMRSGGVEIFEIDLRRGAGKRDEFSDEFVRIERKIYAAI